MPAIQGKRGVSYAVRPSFTCPISLEPPQGAWMNYGFHEDGFTAGLRAVADYVPGVTPPFPIASADRTPHVPAPSTLFVLFEASGARALTAFWGALWLALLRAVLGRVFDLRQLEQELRGAWAQGLDRKSR